MTGTPKEPAALNVLRRTQPYGYQELRYRYHHAKCVPGELLLCIPVVEGNGQLHAHLVGQYFFEWPLKTSLRFLDHKCHYLLATSVRRSRRRTALPIRSRK